MSAMVVVGAGQMGQGIAQVFASAGYQVLLADVDGAVAARGKQGIERVLSRSVEKQKLTAEHARETLARITPTELGELGRSGPPLELAIEAVPEQLPLKVKLFEQLDRVLPESALLASNTSSISLTALGAATRRPERVVGMHFMNPVPVMELVELVRGLRTSDETLEQAKQIVARLGKTAVCTGDSPGFLVNRLLIPMLNEAVFVLESGLATPEDIDVAMKLGTNQPIGPLALADLIGLDTVLSICETLQRELGDDKYRPSPLLRRYVAAGWLGRKTKRGFFAY